MEIRAPMPWAKSIMEYKQHIRQGNIEIRPEPRKATKPCEPLDFTPTDEASILEFFGESVYIVKGESRNDKLTTPEDFEIFANRVP